MERLATGRALRLASTRNEVNASESNGIVSRSPSVVMLCGVINAFPFYCGTWLAQNGRSPNICESFSLGRSTKREEGAFCAIRTPQPASQHIASIAADCTTTGYSLSTKTCTTTIRNGNTANHP